MPPGYRNKIQIHSPSHARRSSGVPFGTRQAATVDITYVRVFAALFTKYLIRIGVRVDRARLPADVILGHFETKGGSVKTTLAL